MSDVLFRNLEHIPLQEEFTPSVVYKISSASRISAVVIGIVSICVFTLSDNAKTAITTISSKNIDNGKCTILSSFSGVLPKAAITVPTLVANDFEKGYSALIGATTGSPDNVTLVTLLSGMYQDVKTIHERRRGNGTYGITDYDCKNIETARDFTTRKFDSVEFLQQYFPTYQSCIDEFSKPPVCRFVPATENLEKNDVEVHDKPLTCMHSVIHSDVRVPSTCVSVLRCNWPQMRETTLFSSYWRVHLNHYTFKCAPSANFTTCESISSKCPEYVRFASGFAKLFHSIHPAEQLCQTFKSNPPYSCESFQVLSPIQVISQTLSLMATTLGGSELVLYAFLKYRRMCTYTPQVAPAPVCDTLDEAQ
jgi:hypothetical protein